VKTPWCDINAYVRTVWGDVSFFWCWCCWGQKHDAFCLRPHSPCTHFRMHTGWRTAKHTPQEQEGPGQISNKQRAPACMLSCKLSDMPDKRRVCEGDSDLSTTILHSSAALIGCTTPNRVWQCHSRTPGHRAHTHLVREHIYTRHGPGTPVIERRPRRSCTPLV
jgi:hypothetical protein